MYVLSHSTLWYKEFKVSVCIHHCFCFARNAYKLTWDVNFQIFRLQPMVRGYNYSAKEPESSVKEQLTGEEKAEKQMELQSRYGTKKAIREVRTYFLFCFFILSF